MYGGLASEWVSDCVCVRVAVEFFGKPEKLQLKQYLNAFFVIWEH